MNKIFIQLLFFYSATLFGQQNSNKIEIGNRFQLSSQILDEEREFQVYLPPTYFFSDKRDYPVVYLVDGDHSFHYTTGLIELMSSVSGKIPECIVVAISDKGMYKYRRNCTPNQIKEKNGNANDYMGFINQELKPFINDNYKTSKYNIIIGHSIGGLFVTNFLLEKPKSFNAFIAIDPAFWLGEYEIINRADSILKNNNRPQSLYYVSSSRAQGMGIDKYVEILEKQFPDKENWKHFNLQNESHGSVALPTLKGSFEHLFENWEITEKKFKSFKSSADVINHYKEMSKKYSFTATIPPYFLGNIIYYYFNHDQKENLLILENGIKEHFPSSVEDFYNQLALNYFEKKEYEKALINYRKSITYNASSFNAYEGMAEVYLSQKKYKKALTASEKSISIAKSINARQYMINQVNGTFEKIKDESNK